MPVTPEPSSQPRASSHKTVAKMAEGVRRDFSEVEREIDRSPEPRWPAVISLLCVGALHGVLPPVLATQFGPRWLLLLMVGILLIPTVISLRMGKHQLNTVFGYSVLITVTLALLYSLYLLVATLSATSIHHLPPQVLLRSAASLWLINVIVFALWYWRLDAGGPHARDLRDVHETGAFLFPQMTLSDDMKVQTGQTGWSPTFVDYLFLAFNHSTALSPTDTAILSRWAKLLIMVQSSISLTLVVLLAAHAVNTLQ